MSPWATGLDHGAPHPFLLDHNPFQTPVPDFFFFSSCSCSHIFMFLSWLRVHVIISLCSCPSVFFYHVCHLHQPSSRQSWSWSSSCLLVEETAMLPASFFVHFFFNFISIPSCSPIRLLLVQSSLWSPSTDCNNRMPVEIATDYETQSPSSYF